MRQLDSAIQVVLRVRLDDRVLIWRRGRAREGRLCIKLCGSVLIEALELIIRIVVETILRKREVSRLAACNVKGAACKTFKCGCGKHGAYGWTMMDVWFFLTGGDVVLKSSEPAELE